MCMDIKLSILISQTVRQRFLLTVLTNDSVKYFTLSSKILRLHPKPECNYTLPNLIHLTHSITYLPE
jgi:hypothetical protein